MKNAFLPINRAEMEERGWEQVDFVYVSGDAYVDHPSFGPAIITRILEAHGYKVAFLAQPDWKDNRVITQFGRPRLGFLVCGGNMDSMVNHYSVSKKRRQSDAYTPGGVIGKRPDYATIVYGNYIRRIYKDVPIIIGGIEASLRRLAHYDYWSDSMKRSILIESQADLISYGMGELSIVEIAEALDSGIPVQDITFVNGTVYKTRHLEDVYDYQLLPSYDALCADRLEYARSYYIQYGNTDPFTGKRMVEPYGEHLYVVQNPPARPLTESEMDAIYDLPYQKTWHPCYDEAGGIPAISEVKFSLIHNRGCFGACSFCALTFHQGRIIQTRSEESLLREAEAMTLEPDFKGYIHDVGGPTANFRHPACKKQLTKGACSHRQCLFPKPCPNLNADHSDYIRLLRKLREIPGVKKVFIRSGIRFDYLLADKDQTFIRELCEYHVSGQLKVAPEHVADAVLSKMGKPENAVYQRFIEKYNRTNQKLGKKQYLVPYLMSSHPGSSLKEAIALAEYLRDLGYMPEQVQDFYPTPSTLSTCMYYTKVDPRTMEPVHVTTDPHEKAMQRALIQYRNPKNYALVEEALRKAGREDLIGYDKHCLIRPRSHGGQKKDSMYGAGKEEKRKQGQSGAAGRKHGKPVTGQNVDRTNTRPSKHGGGGSGKTRTVSKNHKNSGKTTGRQTGNRRSSHK
ncbi:MAG: YgiQ family radical SAM protein [Lachnospiraceae bacterium]|nr:YgiQ family radical SAM protein [Lachnospiraceae bacterium]